MQLVTKDNNLPGMLRLTQQIRHRVYIYLGLGQRRFHGDVMPIVYDLGDRYSFKLDNSKPHFDDGFASFHGLLLSCRAIYVEASTLLYSANWFVIYYQRQQSLQSLQSLTPHALSSLAHLKVVLNQASCHRRNSASRDYWHRDGNGCDLPLKESSTSAWKVVEDWHNTATYLAHHIVPGRLQLSLVCDVQPGEVAVANAVLDSLRLLPRLKDCHIRLCETRDPQLQQLAQQAVLYARGIVSTTKAQASPSPHGPRLLTLPREIRLPSSNTPTL